MAKAAALFVFGVVVAVGVASDQYVSELQKDVKFECADQHIISRLSGDYNETLQDRFWKFDCRKAEVDLANCLWSEFVEIYGGVANFTCQEKEALTGMNSIYNKEKIDRKYRVKCCQVVKKSKKDCYTYGYINEIIQYMDLEVPEKQYITGFITTYDDEYKDRGWKSRLCYFDLE